MTIEKDQKKGELREEKVKKNLRMEISCVKDLTSLMFGGGGGRIRRVNKKK